jgi:hypothetical protein
MFNTMQPMLMPLKEIDPGSPGSPAHVAAYAGDPDIGLSDSNAERGKASN